MASFVTFERLFWAALLSAGFIAGAWVGADKEPEVRDRVVYKENPFREESNAVYGGWDQLVLWKKPDSTTVTHEYNCTVPDWYKLDQEQEPKRLEVPKQRYGSVDLPNFVTVPIAENELTWQFNDGYINLQGSDPRTGRMMEFRKRLPEDTWRGYISANTIAGKNLAVALGTFDVERKMDFARLSLGVGGAAGAAKGKAFAQPVGKVGLRVKLF